MPVSNSIETARLLYLSVRSRWGRVGAEVYVLRGERDEVLGSDANTETNSGELSPYRSCQLGHLNIVSSPEAAMDRYQAYAGSPHGYTIHSGQYGKGWVCERKGHKRLTVLPPHVHCTNIA